MTMKHSHLPSCRALKSHSLGVRHTHFDMISLSQDLYLLSHSFQNYCISFSLILTHFIFLIIFFFSCNSTASLSSSLVVILISKPSTIIMIVAISDSETPLKLVHNLCSTYSYGSITINGFENYAVQLLHH